MPEPRWEKIKELFGKAAGLSGRERDEFLDRECGANAQLRSFVESLLEGGDGAQPPSAVEGRVSNGSTAYAPLTEKAGTRIGPYKLLQQIGEGGFGVVFMADQESPVRRRVALKIIKLGMDTRRVVARFEAERQALAMMDHPNIAKVLDAGTTDTGRPYFVMEYVTGDVVTKFADAHKLGVPERLELFAQICNAVQHAHTKGIIHRDLKPSNVLVSMTDGRPHAKIIDFGIAKATGAVGGTLTDKTLFTEHRQLIGTPEYMSPEQAEGSADIDTRTDVYALGVLLYELLTGLTPFDAKRLRSAAYAEMQRIIKEEEPPAPSVRISRLAAGGVQGPRGQGAEDVGQPPSAVGNVAQPPSAVGNVAQPPSAVDGGVASSPKSNPWLKGPQVEPLAERVSSLLDLAKHRGTEPAKLGLLLRGDLDWIVMKALDKDRARRYETANAFAADVQRHLSGEPVIAAPPSAGYRVRKFVRKHRGQVVAASLIGATLLMATIGMTIALRTTSRALDDAEWHAYVTNLGAAQIAMANRGWKEARERLNSCSKDKRGWEWQHLKLRADTILLELPPAYFAVFSPDSTRVLTISSDDSAQLWDVATGKALGKPMLDAAAASFSPDGTRVLTSPSCIREYRSSSTKDCPPNRIWDVTRNQLLLEFPLEISWSRPICEWNPDGKHILMAADYGVRVLDSVTGKQVGPLIPFQRFPFSVAEFSPNGKLILTASSGETRIWNAATGQQICKLSHSKGSVALAKFGQDSTRVLTASNDAKANYFEVQLWDTLTGVPLGAPMRHDNDVNSAVFSPDGMHVLTVTDEGAVRLWSVTASNPTCTYIWQDGEMSSGVFSPNGTRVLTVSKDGLTRMWDLAGRCYGEAHIDMDYETTRAPVFSPDGRLVMIAGSRGEYEESLLPVRIFSTAQLDWPVRRLSGNDMELEVMCLLNEPIKQVGDSQSGPRPNSADGPAYYLEASSIDGTRRVRLNNDRTLRFIELSSGRELAVLRLNAEATGLKFTPDGTRLILSLAGGKTLVWDTREPAARQADRDVRVTERHAADPYIDTLLMSTKHGDLNSLIRADISTPALRRLVALELLREKMNKLSPEVQKAFDVIAREHIAVERMRAAAQASSDLSPLVREALLRKIADWKPGAKELNQLAWEAVKSPGTSPERLAAVLEAVQESVRREPKDRISMNTLGIAHYRAGQFEEAIKALAWPGDNLWTDIAFTAMCQFKLDQIEQAQAHLSGLKDEIKRHNRIKGRVASRRFTFRFQESSDEGEGWLELSLDGNSFAGKRRNDGSESWNNWDGKRTIGVVRDRFDGLWSSKLGDMWLVTDGNEVHGYYDINGPVAEAIMLIEGRPTTTAPATQPATSQPTAKSPTSQPASAPATQNAATQPIGVP